MFEYFADDTSASARGLLTIPLTSLILTQGYFTLLPLLSGVPPALFWFVDLVALAGALTGLAATGRFLLARHDSLDGRAWSWSFLAIALSLFAGQTFLALTFPWL